MNMDRSTTLAKSIALDEYCQDCGKQVREVHVELFGVTKKYKIMCSCLREKYRKNEEDSRARIKQLKLDNMFKQSRLGELFREATFDKFYVTDESRMVFNKLKDYAVNFQTHYKNKSILLFSSPGTGKTLLASSVVNHLLKNSISAIFITVPDLLMRIKSTYNQSSLTEENLLDGLLDCSLLVMDDIGSESHKGIDDWASSKIYQIINSRYNNLKATIFTTNCNLQDLNDKLSGKTFSRITEMASDLIFNMNGIQDYRMKKFIDGG